jgi:hypothetical protein
VWRLQASKRRQEAKQRDGAATLRLLEAVSWVSAAAADRRRTANARGLWVPGARRGRMKVAKAREAGVVSTLIAASAERSCKQELVSWIMFKIVVKRGSTWVRTHPLTLGSF